MEIEIDGKMVEVDNKVVMEGVKSIPEYNAELDRMKAKGAGEERTTLTTALAGEHTAAIEALNAEHATALETAGKLNSGEKDKEVDGLRDLIKKQATQIDTITTSFATSEANRAQSEKDSAKASVEGKLIIALDGVQDPYNKTNITRDAMDLFDPDTGQFKLSTGVTGGIAEMVAEMKGVHPDKFSSKQPPGNNVKGGGNNSDSGGTPSQQRAADINSRLKKG